MKLGQWEIVEAEVEGWLLWLPTSFINAPEEMIKKHTGGCGPGWLGDILVPDTIGLESVFLACQSHDWMYWEGNTFQEKKYADRIFLVNMTILIQDVPYSQELESAVADIIRLRTVMTYYTAVSYGGGDAFTQGETPKLSKSSPSLSAIRDQ